MRDKLNIERKNQGQKTPKNNFGGSTKTYSAGHRALKVGKAKRYSSKGFISSLTLSHQAIESLKLRALVPAQYTF
jgi:hypothetical protein